MHVVFGAGQVGRWVVRELVAQGEEVLVVRRQGGAIAGARVVNLDAAERGATRDVVRGASVVFNCLSAPYHRWTTELPVLWRSVTDAAAAEGARLVVLDNLYMYGAPEFPISEHTPERPTSRKGKIRKLLADEILERHHRRDLQAVLARASDFIGPALDVTAVFSKRNLERLVRDKPVEVLGDATLEHAFSYTPDVGRALAFLGRAPTSAYGRAWVLPTLPVLSLSETIARLGQRFGKVSRTTRLSPTLLRLLGLVVPTLGELPEMEEAWTKRYVVDASEARELGISSSSLDEALDATAHSFRALLEVGDRGQALPPLRSREADRSSS